MKKKFIDRRIFYPLVYLLIVLISFLPPITAVPFPPQDTQKVIYQVLMHAIPSTLRPWGCVFHLGTLVIIAVIALKLRADSRLFAAYFGINYLIIALVQSMARTPDYGFVIHTGALVSSLLLAVLWLFNAKNPGLKVSFEGISAWRWCLLPFAFLVFWSPMRADTVAVVPDFDPLLIFTSPDYGFTYCFMTPVFLFFLILFHPNVPTFAFRVTAFNALIYAFYNLAHWANPNTYWLGVMHLPLLVLSIIALFLSRTPKNLKKYLTTSKYVGYRWVLFPIARHTLGYPTFLRKQPCKHKIYKLLIIFIYPRFII